MPLASQVILASLGTLLVCWDTNSSDPPGFLRFPKTSLTNRSLIMPPSKKLAAGSPRLQSWEDVTGPLRVCTGRWHNLFNLATPRVFPHRSTNHLLVWA